MYPKIDFFQLAKLRSHLKIRLRLKIGLGLKSEMIDLKSGTLALDQVASLIG